ncbi:hypothetical protein GCM10017673_31200 [Streptosporangium violaceochromogenes]|nr:hypothetical protein GCM10017673_31200 [Streptosporangium violaceochromogenes]
MFFAALTSRSWTVARAGHVARPAVRSRLADPRPSRGPVVPPGGVNGSMNGRGLASAILAVSARGVNRFPLDDADALDAVFGHGEAPCRWFTGIFGGPIMGTPAHARGNHVGGWAFSRT